MKHYILMADIIKSSEKSAPELMDKFKDLANTVNRIFAKNFLSPLTITLGDEFQGVLRSLQSGTEAIIDFEETIIEKN